MSILYNNLRSITAIALINTVANFKFFIKIGSGFSTKFPQTTNRDLTPYQAH